MIKIKCVDDYLFPKYEEKLPNELIIQFQILVCIIKSDKFNFYEF